MIKAKEFCMYKVSPAGLLVASDRIARSAASCSPFGSCLPPGLMISLVPFVALRVPFFPPRGFTFSRLLSKASISVWVKLVHELIGHISFDSNSRKANPVLRLNSLNKKPVYNAMTSVGPPFLSSFCAIELTAKDIFLSKVAYQAIATLHREVLHMAGQLGLDPPTMLLCSGGPTAELELALQNSEAVAKCFHCSISTSAILFTIYCSAYIPSSDRITIQDKLDTFLKQMKLLNLCGENKTEVIDSIVLYVLVPDLPKRASVEVKPVLYAADDTETETDFVTQDLSIETAQSYWGFGHEDWHDSCFQKCIIHGKICAAVLSITDELAAKICSECAGENQEVCPIYRTERQMDRLARFCIFLIDGFLSENHFSWNDVTSGVWNWDSEQKSGSFEFSQELFMCNGEVLHEQNWSEGWVSCCSRSARAAMNSAYDVWVLHMRQERSTRVNIGQSFLELFRTCG
ncbi:hypothetical protein TEA_019171 [Camellia sinensis var. sinensis]|uniref:Uncharacterized protein n=1 Tax=Camellia sinensis var. sinensis TaxID=542762 RepID=A0A4S4EK81_CAMSN|nr:hypothetical protein TEA_019171 [Camellia sinensis var. sinensis]